MVIKVRKMPLIVEAMQFTGTPDNLALLSKWSNGQVWETPGRPGILKVKCLEALAETPMGSYVVRGIRGEVWPVREDIFNETYEIIKEP